MKFTPGPWRYCPQNGSPTTGQHMISGSKPGYLAEIRDCGTGDVVANAQLIAAAPDLFEALHTALPFVEDALEDEFYKEHHVRKAINEIMAAINKARGKS